MLIWLSCCLLSLFARLWIRIKVYRCPPNLLLPPNFWHKLYLHREKFPLTTCCSPVHLQKQPFEFYRGFWIISQSRFLGAHMLRGAEWSKWNLCNYIKVILWTVAVSSTGETEYAISCVLYHVFGFYALCYWPNSCPVPCNLVAYSQLRQLNCGVRSNLSCLSKWNSIHWLQLCNWQVHDGERCFKSWWIRRYSRSLRY